MPKVYLSITLSINIIMILKGRTRPWIVVYGKEAAELDIDCAKLIAYALRKKFYFARVIMDTEFRKIYHYFNIVSVGGQKVNKISKEYMKKVTPRIVEKREFPAFWRVHYCLEDRRGKVCHCDNGKAGIVGIYDKGMFLPGRTKVFVVAGIAREGTYASTLCFIDHISKGKVWDMSGVFCFYHGIDKYGIQEGCWMKGEIVETSPLEGLIGYL
ncbi:MAG: hypothetical protein DRN61_04550 [Thaumarchaeota archaeon]|nr:MAG: hypothetical protein DRN61_04550 [Nitrososphaerota archaeon]